MLSTWRWGIRSQILCLMITFTLIISTGVVADAHYDRNEVAPNECPESLLLKGKELLDHVPEVAGQFPGENRSETEDSEGSWYSPRFPDWLELPSWSWPSLSSDSFETEGDSTSTDSSDGESKDGSDKPQESFSPWVEKAETLLKSQGFEDTDGDGDLNWPEGSPLVGGQNLDIVVIATESSGVVIGFVPIAGDAVDLVAIVIAKDPITGECLSKTDQLLFALSLLLVIPVSAKTLKFVGKLFARTEIDMPVVWRALERTLDNLDFETHTWFNKVDEGFSFTFRNLKNVNRFNRVAFKYWRYRVIVGRGLTTSVDLARKLKYSKFTDSNYREALITFTGRNKDGVAGLEAHHILPQDLEQDFLKRGFDTIHDPRLLAWVDPSEHRKWSHEYGVAWKTFFEQKPNASKQEILEEARQLADDFGFRVLFKTTSWNPFRQVSWPFKW